MKADDVKRLKELEKENAAPEEDRGRARPSTSRHAQGAGRGKLLTPDRRRRAVCDLRERFGVSERRACRVVGQPRSTQRLEPPVPAGRGARPAGVPAGLLETPAALGLASGGQGCQRCRLARQQQADPPPVAPEGLRVPYPKSASGPCAASGWPSVRCAPSGPTWCGPSTSSSTRPTTGGCSSC